MSGVDGDNPADLVACADLAMYEAKRRGTGGYALYGEVGSGDGARPAVPH